MRTWVRLSGNNIYLSNLEMLQDNRHFNRSERVRMIEEVIKENIK